MKYTLLLLFAFALGSCGIKYTASTLPEKQILFGEGGGFSGNVKEYILLENGQLFTRTTFAGTPEELPKVKKKTAETIFQELTPTIMEMEYIKPGNKYAYIQYQVDSSTNYRVVWSESDEKAPEKAVNYFDQLKGLVKPAKE
ncbi:MAG: hypothetical protein R2769_08420 [Saprospiraceae bacterium]|jgi:hypothetical protein